MKCHWLLTVKYLISFCNNVKLTLMIFDMCSYVVCKTCTRVCDFILYLSCPAISCPAFLVNLLVHGVLLTVVTCGALRWTWRNCVSACIVFVNNWPVCQPHGAICYCASQSRPPSVRTQRRRGATIGLSSRSRIVANCSAPKFFNSTSIVVVESIYNGRVGGAPDDERQWRLNRGLQAAETDVCWWMRNCAVQSVTRNPYFAELAELLSLSL